MHGPTFYIDLLLAQEETFNEKTHAPCISNRMTLSAQPRNSETGQLYVLTHAFSLLIKNNVTNESRPPLVSSLYLGSVLFRDSMAAFIFM